MSTRFAGPIETRKLLTTTSLGRIVLCVVLAVGVAFYMLRNTLDQSLGLLIIAALFVLLVAATPTISRFARR